MKKVVVRLFPNPAFDFMTLEFDGVIDEKIEISISDVAGINKAQISERIFETGRQGIDLDVSFLNSGIYTISVRIGNVVDIQRFAVIK
jgi:hypothetical protein